MARFFYTLVLPILALIAIANAAPCEEKGDTVVSAVPEMDDQFYLDESVQIVVNDDIQRYLSAHNTVRARHGARALTWNNTSAGLAQRWANGCKFQHSGGKLGPLGGTIIVLSFEVEAVLIDRVMIIHRKPCGGLWRWLQYRKGYQVLDR